MLASVPDLECGFSRNLFMHWCSNPRNSIIVTTKTSPNTLARRLIDNLKVTSLELEVRRRVPLEGVELEEYWMKEKEKAAAAQAERCVEVLEAVHYS